MIIKQIFMVLEAGISIIIISYIGYRYLVCFVFVMRPSRHSQFRCLDPLWNGCWSTTHALYTTVPYFDIIIQVILHAVKLWHFSTTTSPSSNCTETKSLKQAFSTKVHQHYFWQPRGRELWKPCHFTQWPVWMLHRFYARNFKNVRFLQLYVLHATYRAV